MGVWIYRGAAVLIALACQYLMAGIVLTPSLRVAVAAMCIVGLVIDRWSTVRMLDLIEQANEREIDHGFYETNPFAYQVASVHAFTRSRVVWLVDIGVLVYSILFSWLGVAVLIIRGYAAWANTQSWHTLKALLEEAE